MTFQIDTGATLETGLEAYWKLDEASGTRFDSINSHDLADTGGVGQRGGIVGSASDFVNAGGDLLSEGDSAGLSISGHQSFTMAGWMNFDLLGAGQHIIAMKGTFKAAGSYEYLLEWVAPGISRLQFSVYDGSNVTSVLASTFGALSTGTWYFVTAWHDPVADVIAIQVNNGAIDTAAHSTGLQDGTGGFLLGNSSFLNTSFDGSIDELGFWRKVLSAQEKIDLYNGGSGQTWVEPATIEQTITAETLIDGTSTRTINAATTILSGQPSQTVNADTDILSVQPEQTIDAETLIGGTSEQTVEAESTVLSGQPARIITADTEIISDQPEQTIDAKTLIEGTIEQQIEAETFIKKIGIVQPIGAETVIYLQQEQTITSICDILVREVDLALYKEADLTTPIGTITDPLDFGSIEAGTTIAHPDNQFVLFNDKGGAVNSTDAREVTVSVLQMELVDELVGSSSGGASQTFVVAFPPAVDDNELITVKVNNVAWVLVDSFAGFGPTDTIYTFDATTGTITFGDGFQGQIPPIGNNIKATYTPDTIENGKEVAEQLWIGVQSTGVISNNVVITLEERTPTDTTHVQVIHAPEVVSVSGVYLKTDPNRLGTNYFTSGSFDDQNGIITLGTALPSVQDVLIDYTYRIADDAEGSLTQIGKTVSHTFANPIPTNSGKKLNFQIAIPSAASPSGLVAIKFKLRIEYRE